MFALKTVGRRSRIERYQARRPWPRPLAGRGSSGTACTGIECRDYHPPTKSKEADSPPYPPRRHPCLNHTQSQPVFHHGMATIAEAPTAEEESPSASGKNASRFSVPGSPPRYVTRHVGHLRSRPARAGPPRDADHVHPDRLRGWKHEHEPRRSGERPECDGACSASGRTFGEQPPISGSPSAWLPWTVAMLGPAVVATSADARGQDQLRIRGSRSRTSRVSAEHKPIPDKLPQPQGATRCLRRCPM
jgi:hypothetical protein